MDMDSAVRTLRFGPRLVREHVAELEVLLVEIIDAADTLGEDASGEKELLGAVQSLTRDGHLYDSTAGVGRLSAPAGNGYGKR